ncbi:Zinc finger protein DZIP1L [Chelonia mydas]|uniref:Zinc finger protein DZIP1L n=1 Tax=Chelonia mydas TaxID=8469 RepID=M7BMG6_CHEMY|nr:Zinc finger protein DZIP1L [Chelonia mydas]
MLTNPGGIPAFKFQSRRDSVDWRRFSAIDIERVARELDVTTLQENIVSVTFCNLDSEKCPHCQQPIDPVLLKVLKMAQLTIEYLLHSQEYLTASLALQEEQLQATLEELKRTKQELDKQAEELKGVKEESRRRKKMIATQQLLLQAGTNNYHKCQLCDKAFMNYSYLQAHVQRRHTEASEAERQKKKQVEQMEDEIQELRMKLKETHMQLEIEREAETQCRVQEAEIVRQREEEGRRGFERWKEEERTKFQEEMDGLRQLFLTEFKDIASKNSALEGKTEWKKKLKELQKEHQVEKEELKSKNERLRASLSQEQRIAADRFQQQMGSLNARLKEQTKVIRLQEKTAAKGIPAQTYKNLSSLVMTQQQQKAKKFPNLLSLRDKLVREVTWKVKQLQKDDGILPQQLSVVSAKSQKSPLSPRRVASAKPRALQVELQPYAEETPKPAPRSKASYSHSPVEVPKVMPQSKPSSSRHAAIQHLSTPPFSSEEDSGEDCASLTPVKFKHPITLQQAQTPLRLTQNDETTSDWSDIDSSEGKASPAMRTTPTGTLVSAMAKNLERTLSMPARKPSGGRKLLPAAASDSPKASHSDKKLQFVDENSDLETSSLEEITQLLDAKSQTKQQQQPAVRHSGNTAGSQGTSVWSSNSTRAGGW